MTTLSDFAPTSRPHLAAVLAALERAGCNPRPAGPNRWTALCPVHERNGRPHKPSLSVALGTDDRVLVHCFAGCPTERIMAALGLPMAALMPAGGSRPAARKKPAGGRKPADGPRPTGRLYLTAKVALQALRAKHGAESATWSYANKEGAIVGLVVRWDGPAGKLLKPISLHADGWRLAAMPVPRPLYRLPEILAAPRIFVAEGEKAADALVRCGLWGTTSAGGANAADKSDWAPLAGRRVVILPDNDEAGERYAADVAQCCRAAGASDVRILRLAEHAPELPAGGDIADVLESSNWCGLGLGDAATPEELGNLLCRLADAAPQWVQAAPEDVAPAWEPFPVDALPPPMRHLVLAGAKALQCDPALVALPALAIAAGCIGLTRVLRLKNTWRVPAILWCATVAESGSLKTPAFRLAERALRLRERQALLAYRQALADWERAMETWERERAQWLRAKTAGAAPAQPHKPTARRIVVTDITVERLASLLAENPRGLLLARDELSGWLASFDRYAAHGYASADVAFWLSAHCAEPVRVDRKTNNEHIYVPQAAVSVCGTIQPRTLARSIGVEHRENGLLARLLLAMPPRMPKAWTDADVDPGILGSFGNVLDGLLALEPAEGADGQPEPMALDLAADAKDVWIDYYNRHARECSELQGDLAAAWGKLEEYAARLALVLHLVRCATGDATADAQVVDARSMLAGVTLAEWFKRETQRVYAALEESPEERDRRQLVEWIAGRGGAVTVRQVSHGLRRYLGRAEEAEIALNALAKAGLGGWEPGPQHPQGGRPTRIFRIYSRHQNRNPENPEESGGFGFGGAGKDGTMT